MRGWNYQEETNFSYRPVFWNFDQTSSYKLTLIKNGNSMVGRFFLVQSAFLDLHIYLWVLIHWVSIKTMISHMSLDVYLEDKFHCKLENWLCKENCLVDFESLDEYLSLESLILNLWACFSERDQKIGPL